RFCVVLTFPKQKKSVMLKLMEKGQLQRLLGVKDAVIMGLGSMMGTGAFVSLGIAVGVTGEFFFLSLFLAGFLATLNGLSTAQLAGKYPVSVGAYEYARGEISPFVGFLAGWLFLVAKAASASTAALGAISSLTAMLGITLVRQQTGILAALLVLIVGAFVCF